MRVAIYARTSRVEARQSNIREQIKFLYQYAEKNDYEVIIKYSDNRWCRKHLLRPAIIHLRNDLKFREFKILLVTDIKRLGGSPKDFQKLMDLFERYRVKVIFTKESESRLERMNFTLNLNRLAKKANLSLKIKKGMREAELKKFQANGLELEKIMRKK